PPLVQEAAEWALREALAGERWTEALPLVAARRPEAVAEAFALMAGQPRNATSTKTPGRPGAVA
ncbi:hypothetical protein AB0C13_35910, partial [Streptomyces sp. NPDC049099]|uniref:hypothetical protein n=1 Tax=Streptomyces sp. NPDC049099 TaxID=3155768 RepID=UPI0034245BA5